MTMPKTIHQVDGTRPNPLLSPIVEANGFVFIAGTVGTDPATGAVKAGGFEPECRQMLDNVGRLLRGVGLDFPDVVRSTVYLVAFANWETYNRVYRQYFPSAPPARATVRAGLVPPYGIEIEVTAAR